MWCVTTRSVTNFRLFNSLLSSSLTHFFHSKHAHSFCGLFESSSTKFSHDWSLILLADNYGLLSFHEAMKSGVLPSSRDSLQVDATYRKKKESSLINTAYGFEGGTVGHLESELSLMYEHLGDLKGNHGICSVRLHSFKFLNDDRQPKPRLGYLYTQFLPPSGFHQSHGMDWIRSIVLEHKNHNGQAFQNYYNRSLQCHSGKGCIYSIRI